LAFFVAETDQAKQRIASGLTGNYIYNSAKVLNSSHTIIFCTRTDISAEYLEQLLQQDDSVVVLKMKLLNKVNVTPPRLC
jgi:nitroreductase/dihydropteridine reductase